jgi:hypothetical protein
MNTIPTRILSAILLNPEIEIVPSAGTKNPKNNWREQAKLGKPSMFYSVRGTVLAGDVSLQVTVNDIACRFNADGTFKGLGLEPEGVDEQGNPVAQSQVSAFQADHCAKFHVEGDEIVFDEAPIIQPDGTPFDLAFGVKHFVYRQSGKTLCLSNLRLEVKPGEKYATGFCDGYTVVDEPRPEATGAVRKLSLRAPKAVSYSSERQAARAAKTAVAEDIAL